MESDGSVDQHLGTTEIMNGNRFLAQALILSITDTCKLLWGFPKARNPHTHDVAITTLFSPTGSRQQNTPNTCLISEFPEPPGSMPRTCQVLHKGQRNWTGGVTRVPSFPSGTQWLQLYSFMASWNRMAVTEDVGPLPGSSDGIQDTV